MKEEYVIRKAKSEDIDAITGIYRAIHRQEQEGIVTIGWNPATYPVRETAEKAFGEDTLFVLTHENKVVASMVINQLPLEAYADADWQYDVSPDEVGIVHTLVVHPDYGHKGIARKLVSYFEDYCRNKGWKVARLDTQQLNERAFNFYPKVGYKLIGVYDTKFRNLPQRINLALFEKSLC